MKAGIYNGVKQIEIQELPRPTAGGNDAVIRVIKAGICGTDVHAYLAGGDDVGIHAGSQFGHELVGVVSEIGKMSPACAPATGSPSAPPPGGARAAA